MKGFLDERILRSGSWQAFERATARFLTVGGWSHVRIVGQSGDGGADVIASRNGRRWLVQVKKYNKAIGESVFAETVNAASRYRADVPVIVSARGFTNGLIERVRSQTLDGVSVQLWDIPRLVQFGSSLPELAPAELNPDAFKLRNYQSQACDAILEEWIANHSGNALVVLATGLGKTFVAANSIRRMANLQEQLRVLILAHTNPLLLQLERAFWPFLRLSESTMIVNGDESFSWADLERCQFIFGSRDTLATRVGSGYALPSFDVVLVDECHHLMSTTYDRILDQLRVGESGGPFLIGLTATDWRPDGERLEKLFGDPVIRVDLIDALRQGFLTNVDYRMYTDNIDWSSFRSAHDGRYSPKMINRTMFIKEWDDEVIWHIRRSWEELKELGMQPRGVVFCSNKVHARRMAEQINAAEFTNASTLYSGVEHTTIDRNRILWEFSEGKIGIICAVDIFNEGIDVPDINLVVFQRVTHSRRIFIQQLGRGLRIAHDKFKVIVLDFVNDVRRFAEGIELESGLRRSASTQRSPEVVSAGGSIQGGSTFSFRRANVEDIEGANFLREWLGDVEELSECGEDVSVLAYPSESLVPSDR